MPKTLSSSWQLNSSQGSTDFFFNRIRTQSLNTTDQVVFAGQTVTGDVIIGGNLTVTGVTTVVESQIVEFTDALLVLNYNPIDANMPADINQAGIEIFRGEGQNPYYFVFQESNKTFRVGEVGSTQAVLTRDDNPITGAISIWSGAPDYKTIFTNQLPNSTEFTGPTVTIDNQLIVGTSLLEMTNSSDLMISPLGNLQIVPGSGEIEAPTGVYLKLGKTSITSNASGGTQDDLYFAANSLNIPDQIKMYFGSTVYITSSNADMILSGNKLDLDFPGGMQFPINTPLYLGPNAELVGTVSGLVINATNDIALNAVGNVIVPTQVPLVLGSSYFVENSSEDVDFDGTHGLNLNVSTQVSIPTDKPLVLGGISMLTGSTTGVTISSSSDIFLDPYEAVHIPVDIYLDFGSYGSIHQNSFDNSLQIINSSGDIALIPSVGHTVSVPTNVAVKYGSVTEKIIGNGQDLTLAAAEDIILESGRQILVPQSTRLSFGGSTQNISGTLQNLSVSAQSRLYLNAPQTIVSNPVVFGDITSSSVISTFQDGLKLSSANTVYVNSSLTVQSTLDATSQTNASVMIAGGAAIAKQIITGEGIQVVNGTGYIQVKSTSVSLPSVLMSSSGIPVTISSSGSGDAIELKTTGDTTGGYIVGRGTNSVNNGQNLEIKVPAPGAFTPQIRFADGSGKELAKIDAGTGNMTVDGILSSNGHVNQNAMTTDDLVISGVASFDASAGVLISSSTTFTSVVQVGDGISITGDHVNITSTASPALNVNGAVTASTLLVGSTTSFAGNVDMGGNFIQNLALTPSAPSEAATKYYVDSVAQGLSVKDSVVLASHNQSVALDQFLASLDSVSPSVGQRVLLKDQSNPVENGIYIVQSTGLTRADDYAAGSDAAATYMFVSKGNYNAGMGFVCTSPEGSAIVGTNQLTFTQFSGAGELIQGDGITISHNQVSAHIDQSSLEYDVSGAIRISTSALGVGLVGGSGVVLSTSSDQSNVRIVGTLTQGTWQADTIETTYGGTGLTSIPTNSILLGGAPSMTYSDTFVFTGGRLGVGTSTPVYDIQVSASQPNVNITGVTSSAYSLVAGTCNSTLSLNSSGRLNMDAPKINLSASSVPGVFIDANANVGIQTTSPSTTLTVNGVVTAPELDAPFINMNNNTVTLTGTAGQLLVHSNATIFDKGIQTSGVSQIGSIFIGSSGGGNSLVQGIIELRTSQTDVVGVVLPGMLRLPQITQFGTSVNAQVTAGNLVLTGGAPVVNALNWSNSGATSWYDSNNNTSKFTIQTIGTITAMSNSQSGTALLIGQSSPNMDVVIQNGSGTDTIRYSPVAGDAPYTSTFVISSGIETSIGGRLNIQDDVFDTRENGLHTIFTQVGWYYIGVLAAGETTMYQPSCFGLKLDVSASLSVTEYYYYGVLDYEIIVYHASDLTYRLFVKTSNVPTGFDILKTPGSLTSPVYEGLGVSPDGTSSGYTNTWVSAFDTATASSTGSLNVGSIVSAANLSVATVTDTLQVSGSLNASGNVFFTGTAFGWGYNTGSFAVSNTGTGVNLNMNSATSDSLAINLTQGGASSSIVQSSSGLGVSNNNGALSSLVFGTNNGIRQVIDAYGNVSITSTRAAMSSITGALTVAGGIAAKAVNIGSGTLQSLAFASPSSSTSPVLTNNGGALDIGGVRVTNLALIPLNNSDAVSKLYVDNATVGLSIHQPCVATTTGSNVDLSSPLTTLDGVSIPIGSRVLIKDQTNGVENGIYVTTSGGLTRASDMPDGNHGQNSYTFTTEGNTFANCGWICVTTSPNDIIGTNTLQFVQFSAAQVYTAGSGLILSGTQFSTIIDNFSLEYSSLGAIRISTSALGVGLSGGSGTSISVSSVTHLSSLGTITSGVWQASTLRIPYGGTGNTSFNNGAFIYYNPLGYFDSSQVIYQVGNKVGIYTSSPSSGLTLANNNFEISGGTVDGTAILQTSTLNGGFGFGMRTASSSKSWIFSGGNGTSLSGWTDFININNVGTTTLNYPVMSSSYVTIGNYQNSGSIIQKTTSGAFAVDIFSLDNSGTYYQLWGSQGTAVSHTSGDFLRVGYYSGTYTLNTASLGGGSDLPLCIGATSSPQLKLSPNGSSTFTSTLTIGSTLDTTSATTGALLVSGGVGIRKSLLVDSMFAVTDNTLVGFPGTVLSSTGLTLGSSMYLSMDSYTLQVQGSSYTLESGTGPTQFELLGNNTAIIAGSLTLGCSTSSYISASNALEILVGGGGFIFSSTGNLQVTSGTVEFTSTSGSAVTIDGGLVVTKVNATNETLTNLTSASIYLSGGNVILSSSSNGQVNVSGAYNTSLNLYQANSSSNYLSLNTTASGYQIQSQGSTTALSLSAGLITNQLKLNTDTTVLIGSSVEATSATSGALRITGGLAVGGHSFLNGGVIAGPGMSSTSGQNLLQLNGFAPWAFVQPTVNVSKLTLQSQTSGNVFTLSDYTGTDYFEINTGSVAVSMYTPTRVATSSSLAFQVMDSSTGSAFFVVDTFNGLVDVKSHRVTNVAIPTNPTDAVNKMYVDNAIEGLNLKEAVIAASIIGSGPGVYGNVDLTQAYTSFTLDGVVLATGSRVLLMNQTNTVENGVYIVSLDGSTLWTRADDFAVGTHQAGAFMFIQSGTVHQDQGYVCIAQPPNDVVGTDSLYFTQFNGNTVSAGNGLTKDINNIMSVYLDTYSGLSFNGSALRVDPSIAGSGISYSNGVLSVNNITSLGVITVGTWHASTIAVPYGGTGNTFFTDGALVFGEGQVLTGDTTNLYWDNTNKALGVRTNTPTQSSTTDALAIANSDIVFQTTLTSSYTQGISFTDNSGNYQWRLARKSSNLSIANGTSTDKSAMTDVLVVRPGAISVGYSAGATISATVDILGSLHATSAYFDNPIGVTSGGTGRTSLQGLVIGQGTSPFTSTGAFSYGSVPIGNTSGAIVLQSGGTLRTTLGLSIGADVEAWSASLDDIAGLTKTYGNFIVANGSHWTSVAGNSPQMTAYLGLGNLAYANTVNNSSWSGTALSVANGGTGVTTFLSDFIPVYTSSSGFTSSALYVDPNTGGIAIGSTSVASGNTLQIQSGDASFQNSIVFQDSSLLYWWSAVRSSDSLVFSGPPAGVGQSDKTNLVEALALSTDISVFTGALTINSTTPAISASSTVGALIVEGGAAIASNLFVKTKAQIGSSTVAPQFGLEAAVISSTANQLGGVRVTVNDAVSSSDVSYKYLDMRLATSGSSVVSGKITGKFSGSTESDFWIFSSSGISTPQPVTIGSSLNITGTLSSTEYSSGYISMTPQSITDSTSTTSGLIVSANSAGLNTTLDISNKYSASTTSSTSILRLHSLGYSGSTNQQEVRLVGGIDHAALYTSASGSGSILPLYLYTGSQTNQAVINTDGTIALGSTVQTSSATTGALTLAGGLGVQKDMYIGGNLSVAGSIIGYSQVSSPSITISSLVNISSTPTVNNSKALVFENEVLLTVVFSVFPTASGVNTQFNFSVPNVSSNFTDPWQIAANVSGYTDTTNLIVLYNMLCVVVPGGTNALVKFQSQSTSEHIIIINARYSR